MIRNIGQLESCEPIRKPISGGFVVSPENAFDEYDLWTDQSHRQNQLCKKILQMSFDVFFHLFKKQMFKDLKVGSF